MLLPACSSAPFLELEHRGEGSQTPEQSAWERDGAAPGDMIIAALGSARIIAGIYDLGSLSNLNNFSPVPPFDVRDVSAPALTQNISDQTCWCIYNANTQ